MLNFMGIIKKKFLDIARSSNAILKIIWKVDKVHKAFDYYWDLTTINIKKIIDSKEFCKNKNYLDMGCGQIAILGMYAKYMCPNMNVTSVDYYLEFVTNAKKVISLNNINIEVINSNLFDKVKGRYDCISFNPPYKSTESMNKISHEYTTYSGNDGLYISRRFLDEASEYLTNNGTILLGINNYFTSRESCIDMIAGSPFQLVREYKRKFNTSTVYELCVQEK